MGEVITRPAKRGPQPHAAIRSRRPTEQHLSLALARLLLATATALTLSSNDLAAQTGPQSDSAARPRVFLDKSPRIVWYQLNRLDNRRLLRVERKPDHLKYAPVYTAILTRGGMSRQHRDDALSGLVALSQSDASTQLLVAIERLDADDRQQQRTARQLATMLLGRPLAELTATAKALQTATRSSHPLVQAIGYAGLIAAGQPAAARKLAAADSAATLAWLTGIRLLPQPAQRSTLRSAILPLLGTDQPAAVRRAVIETLASVPPVESDTFRIVAPFVSDQVLRADAIRTLLRVPNPHREGPVSAALLAVLVRYAESTPTAERTRSDFLEAMQLADQLLTRLPASAARTLRSRLREITVRVVLIRTVAEEMRYDVSHFAVEAGRPVQVVLDNRDLMPHHLRIATEGSLKEVAQRGLAQGPPAGFQGKPYVPRSAKVLFATGMVGSHQQERLTFTAPQKPGEYPFVCTFPRHWMRMYGVMVVVEDLDAWLQNPTAPKDPLGSNRRFVRSWTVEDFAPLLGSTRPRGVPEIGRRLLQEASCVLCHKVNGQGGGVGPELAGVLQRWKGDRAAVLREILEPSHRVDPKYAMHVIVTTEGQVLSGMVTASDKKAVSVLVNPESPKPIVVPRQEIDEMVQTSKSMMPKALLDRFTKNEVLEVLAYLEALPQRAPCQRVAPIWRRTAGRGRIGARSRTPQSPRAAQPRRMFSPHSLVGVAQPRRT